LDSHYQPAFFFGVVPPSIAEVPLNMESGVDRFLTSIPSGYYTIANVEGLKNLLKNSQTLV
jgi:hypothetical protein